MTFAEKYTDSTFIEWNDNRSRIVLRDKGQPREYNGENVNRKNHIVYRVDGGLDNTANKKCDYALYLCDEKNLYFIELKGKDYSTALSQIEQAIKTLVIQAGVDTLGLKIYARVVLSRMANPRIRVTQEMSLKTLLKKYNGNLQTQAQKMIENL